MICCDLDLFVPREKRPIRALATFHKKALSMGRLPLICSLRLYPLPGLYGFSAPPHFRYRLVTPRLDTQGWTVVLSLVFKGRPPFIEREASFRYFPSGWPAVWSLNVVGPISAQYRRQPMGEPACSISARARPRPTAVCASGALPSRPKPSSVVRLWRLNCLKVS